MSEVRMIESSREGGGGACATPDASERRPPAATPGDTRSRENARENDGIVCFVSTTERKKKGVQQHLIVVNAVFPEYRASLLSSMRRKESFSSSSLLPSSLLHSIAKKHA